MLTDRAASIPVRVVSTSSTSTVVSDRYRRAVASQERCCRGAGASAPRRARAPRPGRRDAATVSSRDASPRACPRMSDPPVCDRHRQTVCRSNPGLVLTTARSRRRDRCSAGATETSTLREEDYCHRMVQRRRLIRQTYAEHPPALSARRGRIPRLYPTGRWWRSRTGSRTASCWTVKKESMSPFARRASVRRTCTESRCTRRCRFHVSPNRYGCRVYLVGPASRSTATGYSSGGCTDVPA